MTAARIFVQVPIVLTSTYLVAYVTYYSYTTDINFNTAEKQFIGLLAQQTAF